MKSFFTHTRIAFGAAIVLLFLTIGVLYKESHRLPTKKFARNTPQGNLFLGARSRYQGAGIYISGGDIKYAAGGLISLSSEDEPAITINAYGINNTANIVIYEVNKDFVFSYLLHDKDGKQIIKDINTSSLRQIGTTSKTFASNDDSAARVTLPINGNGTWYVTVTIGDRKADAVLVRSSIGVVAKEGDNQFVFWAQDFRSKRSVSDASITLLGLLDQKKDYGSAKFNSDGIATAAINAQVDIGLIEARGEIAVVPLNLRYLSYGRNYTTFAPKSRINRYFIFTDRPVYQPGDTVYFKAIIRDDDDARYSVPKGDATVKISKDWSDQDILYDKKIAISADGTIEGKYELPKDDKTGYFVLKVTVGDQVAAGRMWNSDWTSNTVSFAVEHYRKPEFSIGIESEQKEIIAGDSLAATVKGSYFSGEPLAGRTVTYSVTTADFFEYQFATDARAYQKYATEADWYRAYANNKVAEGTVTLDNNGEAKISLDTKNKDGTTKIYVIQATIQDGAEEKAFAAKNILVYAGEYGIYRSDTRYTTRISTPVQLSLELLPNLAAPNPGKVAVSADVTREWWEEVKKDTQKYPQYEKREEALSPLSISTDNTGKGTLSFTPEKTGSYILTTLSKDRRGNVIKKKLYIYATEKDQPIAINQGENSLTVAADKKRYEPTDAAVLSIVSDVPDRDVLLTIERGRVERYQVVKLTGKSTDVRIPLETTDVPNVFAHVSSFSPYWLDEATAQISVSTEAKKLDVKLIPVDTTTGPGETMGVTVQTLASDGKPVSADVAVWAVDKAIFELSDNRLGSIFDEFWKERYNSTVTTQSLEGISVNQAEGGGCFVGGTGVLMASGRSKNIADIQVGDIVMSRTEKNSTASPAKVVGVHQTHASGYMIINTQLKVTANHLIWVNNTWKEAGSIQVGDSLMSINGNKVSVTSVEYLADPQVVYNLEVQGTHTYFAGGVWVHNQKGGERSIFKDTAYWNPSVRTGADGKAVLQVKLPDNLTTWVFSAVASTADTQVGQTMAEVTVSKAIAIRPTLPNILYEGDEAELPARVQNFSSSQKTLDVTLTYDGGEVTDTKPQSVTLLPKESKVLVFKVKAGPAKAGAAAVFDAKVRSDESQGDKVRMILPVLAYGFFETTGSAAEGNFSYAISLPSDASNQNSTVTLSLAPTMLGALPKAFTYLVDYPYGCTEQTTSRLMPALIAKMYPAVVGDGLKDKDLNVIIQKGLDRLKTLQQPDGGWTWWFTGKSEPYVSAYVMEYLTAAKKLGIAVDGDMYNRGKDFVTHGQNENTFENAVRMYTYGVLGQPQQADVPANEVMIGTLQYTVLANVLSGNKNPETNGLLQLLKAAKTQGDAVYWEAAGSDKFGSRDASTALAIRALLASEDKSGTVVKAVRYLTRNNKQFFWTNTFATSQVVRALAEYTQATGEFTPHESYTVSIDGAILASGSFTKSTETKEIQIPREKIGAMGSKVDIKKSGDGHVYSSLVSSLYRTDRNLPALSSGMHVSRSYTNARGSQYGLGVGDTVLVKLTLSGLQTEGNFGVIADELPAGMVPINEQFKNSRYDQQSVTNDFDKYSTSGTEITQNGIVLSMRYVPTGERTYTYRARVIAGGTFIAPPAVASLMYAPEIHARTVSNVVKLNSTAQAPDTAPLIEEEQLTPTNPYTLLLAGGAVLLLSMSIIATGAFFLRKRIPKAPTPAPQANTPQNPPAQSKPAQP